MKRLFCTIALIGAIVVARATTPADTIVSHATCPLVPEGKAIYIPRDLRNNDFESDTAQWSFHRMACTSNVVVFWEKGFGDDLSKAPDLDGHPMTVDLPNLLARLEYFYQTYRDQYKFTLPGSKADRLRMMVMLNYSLEGTAYGGDYDDTIGALWIAPNRVQDKRLNCIAHEIGHSFQIQIACDGEGSGAGGGFYEMTSQWMLWQVNPEWTTDENYHWEAFRRLTHKRFLDVENIYHSPYVLEYWSMRHGTTVIANIFRNATKEEDPAQTYMRMYNLTLDEMADEMYDAYSRLVTFDFPRVKESHTKYACQLTAQVSTTSDKRGTKIVPVDTPETYGFNVVELPLTDGKAKTMLFEGLGDAANDGFRYGVVLVDDHMQPTYLPMYKDFKGKLTYCTTADTRHAYLVVVGCPIASYDAYTFNPYGRKEKQEPHVYPYQIILKK